MRDILLRAVVGFLLLTSVATAQPAAEDFGDFEMLAIDRVWSGHRVPFAILADQNRIFVGYYDANRQLSIASSTPKRLAPWTFQKLDSWVGWDGHNSVALGLDGDGQLHVAANMHSDPLVYYRTTRPGDVRTLRRIEAMAAPNAEQRVTYPVFLSDAQGNLVFKYRDGGSGRGNEIFLRYSPKQQAWLSLHEGPLVDGEGKRNGYFEGPIPGPDGWFHLLWVWRDNADASSTHDLSYARSRDLVNWEKSDGTEIAVPFRLSTTEIVDPVAVKGGMINNNVKLAFDSSNNVVAIYHKFDETGQTQVYLARRDEDGWQIKQLTHWKNFRWDFGGGGTLPFRLKIFQPQAVKDGQLVFPIERDGQSIDLIVDATSLSLLDERQRETLGEAVTRIVGETPDMNMQIATDGHGPGPFALAWAARRDNRDRPAMSIPAPATLWLLAKKAR